LKEIYCKIDIEKITNGCDAFALAVLYLTENNDAMAKAFIEKYKSLHEEGSGYIIKILNALLLIDSNSFNQMMNLFLDDCFGDGKSNLYDSMDEEEYLEMLAMEHGVSKEGLLGKIKKIAKRKKLYFDGIEDLPENELVLFIEENNLFKKSIPNPWFMELSNIDWIFTPALVLIVLAKYRAINVTVEHPFVPKGLYS
jgi:hypothetical protein